MSWVGLSVRKWRSSAVACFACAALVSACGGSGGAPSTVPSTSTATSTTMPTSTTTTPESTTTSTTSPGSTTGPPDGPTTTTGTEIDETALALLGRSLYNVPGAGLHCDDLDLSVTYMFPADGGDLYAICLDESIEWDGPISFTVATPQGQVVTDITVERTDRSFADVVGFTPFALLVEGPQEVMRLHGLELRSGDYGVITIPFLLPHNRPAGSWTVAATSKGRSDQTEFEIDRPCATSSTSTGADS